MKEFFITFGIIFTGFAVGKAIASHRNNHFSDEDGSALDKIAEITDCNAFKTSEAQCFCIGAKAGYQDGKGRRLK